MLKKLTQTTDDYGLLVLRLGLALVMFPHGAQKMLGWFGGHGFSGTMVFFTAQLGIPTIFAFLAIMAEFLGPIGLATGLFTRLAALGIGSVMAVATTMHWDNGFFMNWVGTQKGEGFEFHILAIAMSLALMIKGGGAHSIDKRIERRL